MKIIIKAIQKINPTAQKYLLAEMTSIQSFGKTAHHQSLMEQILAIIPQVELMTFVCGYGNIKSKKK
jgi:hypothetical protein